MQPSGTPSPPPAPPGCPSCGSERLTCVGDLAPGVHFAGRLMDPPLPGGRLYRCTACRLSFRHPTLPKAQLDALYRQGDPACWDYDPARRADWTITRRWLDRHVEPGRILDVGCFDGAFLAALGAPWQGFGLEISEAAIRKAQARGITIIGRNVDDLAMLEPRFDVVTAFDLIEHFEDPRALLRRMAACTMAGGVVILGTGNTQAAAWRLMGSHYWYCALPEHQAFISEAWCRAAADALGLTLAHLERYSHDAHRPLHRRAGQLAKNLAYRFAPRLFHQLRGLGLGGIDTSRHPALRTVPPVWTAAKDHLLAIFRKP